MVEPGRDIYRPRFGRELQAARNLAWRRLRRWHLTRTRRWCAIESLAVGTPVIARRVGALPEIVRHGVDGFLADDPPRMAFLVDRVAELDRSAIRSHAHEEFSASRMVDDYEEVYATMLSNRRGDVSGNGHREWDNAIDEWRSATRETGARPRATALTQAHAPRAGQIKEDR